MIYEINDFERYVVSGKRLKELLAGKDSITSEDIALASWCGASVRAALEELIEQASAEETTDLKKLDSQECIQRVKTAVGNSTIPETLSTIIFDVLEEKR